MTTLMPHKLGFLVDPEKGIVYGRPRYTPAAGGKRGERYPVGCLRGGYIKVSYGKAGCIGAHRLVWESMYGPVPEGLEVHHLNSIRTDNRIANLALVTKRVNVIEGKRLARAAKQVDRLASHVGRQIVATTGRVGELYWAKVLGISSDAVMGYRARVHKQSAAFAASMAKRTQ